MTGTAERADARHHQLRQIPRRHHHKGQNQKQSPYRLSVERKICFAERLRVRSMLVTWRLPPLERVA